MHTTATPMPSIVRFLTENEFKSTYFVKPPDPNGANIVLCHAEPDHSAPAATVLSIRHLRLMERRVIPFHLRRQHEEVYIRGEDAGEVLVLLSLPNGAVERISLTHSGERLIIPPHYPHALLCTKTRAPQASCDMLIIASSQDDTDVEWETNTPWLLENIR